MKNRNSFPHLFEAGQIGKVRIKNRIVMSTMGATYWGIQGEVTDRLIDYFVARAKGGVGLISVGFASVNYPSQYRAVASLDSDNLIPGHNLLVEKLHDYGAKVLLQINHTGRAGAYSDGQELVSCSPLANVRLGEIYPVPRALGTDEIYHIIERFGKIALRARRAGYDMVEIHGAHGYLVNSFISPHMNVRNDEFGGSVENRMRFPVLIIKCIKEMAGPDFPVGIRISGDEFLEDGITTRDSPKIARTLEEAGASFIHVSAGLDEVKHKQIDAMRLPEGWKSYIWEAIKKAVSIPTFAAGGNRTPEFCEKVLAEGKADYVALARQLLADPEWPHKVEQGNLDDVRYCISCLECMGFRAGRSANMVCSVNPALGREKEFETVRPAQNPLKLMIIGAGPAGMEAARVAAIRGHNVTIFDKNQEIGGQLLLAAAPPGKNKILWLRNYEISQLKKLGVKFNLGITVTPQIVKENNPDALIIATGSRPRIPKIKGIDGINVATAHDIFERKKVISGKSVIVAGGGMVGAEAAEYLAEQGNTVTIIEMLERIAGDMEMHNRKMLLDALENKRVTTLTEHKVLEISDQGVIVFDKAKNTTRVIKGDYVVLAMGGDPVDELYQDLRGKVPNLYVIGDCKEPRTIIRAVYEGAIAAQQI
jgi:2,4-dienoyl-CoA reductase-like NADH-dependent reductase (Old Yellow Enzyme family)/NADPH-dependent 2,4-dienoyl-CoA reductase/sulfur reductase-like enzyme